LKTPSRMSPHAAPVDFVEQLAECRVAAEQRIDRLVVETWW